MDVTIDAHVANVLLEPGDLDDTQSTAFNIWWHTQLLDVAYNAG
jgi:hypothetical protein